MSLPFVHDPGPVPPLATSPWDALWFRVNGTELSSGFNTLYYFIFWISAAFFVLLMFLTVWWMIKYKRREGVPAEPSAAHNTPLEIAWSVIPAIGFGVMFFWGVWAYLPKTVVPAGAEVIEVEAGQWVWNFTYDNGAGSLQTEIVADVELPLFAIPAGKPVKFLLSSKDVIHSFYIPEFRIKRDCLPNRYTVTWAEATTPTHYFDADLGIAVPYDLNDNGTIDPGEQGYYLYCTEYCGDQHSQMTSRIAVMSSGDYEAWKAAQNDTSGIPLVELGQALYTAKGCASCHSVDGSAGSGPTWLNIWDQPRPGYVSKNPDENPRGVVDFQYVRESILQPNVYMAPGFPNGGMASYEGQFTSRELLAVATYIKSLNSEFAAEATADSEAELAAQEGGGEEAAPEE